MQRGPLAVIEAEQPIISNDVGVLPEQFKAAALTGPLPLLESYTLLQTLFVYILAIDASEDASLFKPPS